MECCWKRTGKCCERSRLTAIVWHCARWMFRPRAAGQQVIIPRKGVLELQRSAGHGGRCSPPPRSEATRVRAQIGDVRFTSKLIDGRFPEYSRVIPAAPPKAVVADREVLRSALQRTSILANEKYRGIRLALKKDSLTPSGAQPGAGRSGGAGRGEATRATRSEVGFNVSYLLDALAAVEGTEVEIGVTDGNSSCLVRAPGASERPVCRDADAPVRSGCPSAVFTPSDFVVLPRLSSNSIPAPISSSARTRQARPACSKPRSS